MADKDKTIRFKKPPLSASVFALLGVGILLSLGTWQGQKYIVKTKDYNAEICAQNRAPIYTDNFTALDQSPYAACLDKITLSGKLLHAIQIPVGPRMHNEQMGYHLYVPLQGADGSTILVNTGWTQNPEMNISPAIAAKNIHVMGSLIRPSAPNHFTPDNNPSANQWFSIKMREVRGQHSDLSSNNLADQVFVASAMFPPDAFPAFTPAEMAKSFLTPQMHIQYAAFWYFMTLALLGVFIFRFVVVGNKNKTE